MHYEKTVIILTAVVLFGWLLSTQLIRWGWVLLALALALGAVLRRPKARQTVLLCAGAAALLLAVGSYAEPWTELARFTLLRGAYERSAREMTRSLDHIPGMSWHSEKGSLFLTGRGEIICEKDQGQLKLYYEIKRSFFNSYGFLYAAEGLSTVDDGPFAPDQVDEVHPIDDHWAYLKLY